MHAQATSAARQILFQLVRRFDDFARGMQHRFPRRRHDARDESRRALARIFQRSNGDCISLIAIEQELACAVGVNVDESRRDVNPRRNRNVGGAIRRQNFANAAMLDGNARVRRRTVAACKHRRTERKAVRLKAGIHGTLQPRSPRLAAPPIIPRRTSARKASAASRRPPARRRMQESHPRPVAGGRAAPCVLRHARRSLQ